MDTWSANALSGFSSESHGSDHHGKGASRAEAFATAAFAAAASAALNTPQAVVVCARRPPPPLNAWHRDGGGRSFSLVAAAATGDSRQWRLRPHLFPDCGSRRRAMSRAATAAVLVS